MLDSMQLPLSLAILALIGVIGGLSWLFVRSEARSAAAHAEMMRVSKEYADQALKMAADTARNQPKYADKMLDSLARGIGDVTRGTAEAMQAIYGPVRIEERQQTAEYDDLPTPWYTKEGAMDFTDPTDEYLVSDPTEYPEGGGGMDGSLISDGDDEPFGVPGLKVNG